MKYLYVCQLPAAKQLMIRRMLSDSLADKTDIERGMNSRLCDLEDTIDISQI